VAFIEILGVDAIPLRLHLEVATSIMLYFTQSSRNLDNRATRKIQQYIGESWKLHENYTCTLCTKHCDQFEIEIHQMVKH
jgi:hypothetical protein